LRRSINIHAERFKSFYHAQIEGSGVGSGGNYQGGWQRVESKGEQSGSRAVRGYRREVSRWEW